MLLFSRQAEILYILDTTILILYRKLYINIVSIIVLNIEASQYNIKINLAVSAFIDLVDIKSAAADVAGAGLDFAIVAGIWSGFALIR